MIRATLAIIRRPGQILLGYKTKGVEEISDIVNAPGGKQEPGETLEECLVREVKDETGIMLMPDLLKKIAVLTCYAGGQRDIEIHVFWTDTFHGTLTKSDAMVPQWYDIQEIPYDRMLAGDRLWFAKAVDGMEKFAANIYYERRAEGFIGMKTKPFPEDSA